ncbi:MAG: YbaN family protein [Spirochaetes bacterium]|nr:YbaN family protein [Spirochaetota bacterium]
MAKTKLMRLLLVIAGCLFLMLGIMGIVLPLLPSTPFFLLAAACFVRSSQRLYRWLIAHPVFGRYIHYYRTFRAVPLHAKVIAITLLWLTISCSAIFAVQHTALRAVLFCIAAVVTIFLTRMRTLTAEQTASYRKMMSDGTIDNK